MPAGGCFRNGGGIDVRAGAGVPLDEFLFGHDLEELEDRRVSDGAAAGGAQRLVHVAHGTGSALPQHTEDGQLGIGGTNHRFKIRMTSYLSIRRASYFTERRLAGRGRGEQAFERALSGPARR